MDSEQNDSINISFRYTHADYALARLLYFPQTTMSLQERVWSVTQAVLITGVFYGILLNLYRSELIWVSSLFIVIIAVLFGITYIEWLGFFFDRFMVWLCLDVQVWLKKKAEEDEDISKVLSFLEKIPFLKKRTDCMKEVASVQYDFRFDDWGGFYKTNTMNFGLAWVEYEQVLENEYVFILVYGKQRYWTIPKHVFPDEIIATSFRDLLKSKIDNYLDQRLS